MTRGLAGAAAVFLWAGTPASAHRPDEYLQATTILVEKDRVQAQIHLTPGAAIFPAVLAAIDSDADGAVSAAEQRAYGERVLRDVSLTMDGQPVRVRLVSIHFASIGELKEGRGDIEIKFIADVPAGSGPRRKLTYENHHESRVSAYLVNCVAPRDPDIRITAQKRNFEQSTYELNYVQAGLLLPARWFSTPVWVSGAALLLLARLASVWRQGR